CLTLKKIATDISGGAVYADATQAPDGTYTEIVGGFNTAFPAKCVTSGDPSTATFCKRFSFTGYRSIRVTPTLPSFDLFGRLNNGNVCNINADDTRCNASITTGSKPEDPLDFLR